MCEVGKSLLPAAIWYHSVSHCNFILVS